VVLAILKNDGVKVSWDDDSQLNGKITNVPNHQPVSLLLQFLLPTIPNSHGLRKALARRKFPIAKGEGTSNGSQKNGGI